MAVYTLVKVHVTGQVVDTLGNYPNGIGITLRADAIAAVFFIFLLNVFFLFSIMLLFNYHKKYMNKLFFLFLFFGFRGLS